MLYQFDYITADIAVPTIEDILLRVDAEPIVTAALRARADHFCADPFEVDASPRDLIFDRHRACAIDPRGCVDRVDSDAHVAIADFLA
jgi:hypothetical protein